MKEKSIREYIQLILNVLIVIFAVVGTAIMFNSTKSGTGLTTSGVENLKFFTVLSNEFCAVVSVCWIVFFFIKKKFPVLPKLMAAAAVGLTFLIIAAFLAPMYPDLNLYEGGNFWFHLIIPLVAMVEFVILRVEDKIPFRYTFISATLALIYGLGYLVNILINGVGAWPDSNDWYGFLNWGWPIGFCIFGAIVVMNWGMACLLRGLNSLVGRFIKM